jgi:hypothetical protein
LRGGIKNLIWKGSWQNIFYFIFTPLVYFQISATLLSRQIRGKKGILQKGKGGKKHEK